jgi:hypothetical protein
LVKGGEQTISQKQFMKKLGLALLDNPHNATNTRTAPRAITLPG